MNIVHKKMEAAVGAHVSGYSLVRRSIAIAALAVAALSPAHAMGDNGRDPQRAAQFQRETLGADRSQQNQRQAEERQRQYDDQRRQYQMERDQNAGSDAFRRSGRLTPDERRDLRRQINEAGAEIYQRRR